MTTAYTSLLGFALPVTGELSGTWGDTVNNGITSLLDSAIAGTTTLSADSDVTLTTTQGSSNTAREAILLWTAGGSATRTITAPAQSKIYTVINASSGTQSIILAGAGPTSGVTIAKGESALCAWNGSDFIKISNTAGPGTFTNLTVTGNTSLGDADTDTITQAASYVTGTQLKSAKTATNTLSLAAYDVDGTAYTNLITLTASNTPTLALTSTGVGTINNMSIGATTASTGAFTTLSASSTVTLSGGTENGVAYLNGSKVLTTGSALVFDGTNLGVGVTLSAWSPKAIQVGSWGGIQDMGGVANQIAFRGNQYYNSGDKFLNASGYANAIALDATNGIVFYTSTLASTSAGSSASMSQRMTLNTSGLLSIGRNTPYDSNAVLTLEKSDIVSAVINSTTNSVTLVNVANGSSSIAYTGTASNHPFALFSNAQIRLYIDTGGNVGIGTSSPSTGKFSDASYALLVQSASTSLGTNIFSSNSDNSRFVGLWSGHSGATSSIGVKSGTALAFGAWSAITGVGGFSEWGRFDASGNLGVGISSIPSGVKLYVYQPNASTDVKVQVGTTTGTNSAYQAFVNNTVTTVGTENSSGGNLVSGSSAYATILSNNGAYPLQFGTNNAVRATITSGGNLGVGTDSPTEKLQVNGAIRLSSNAVNFTGSVGTSLDYYSSTARLAVYNGTDNSVMTYSTAGVLSVGSGIAFPATQVPSASANTLDDYEEGTWTPTLTTSGTAATGITYAFREAFYTKIGNIVRASFGVKLNGLSTNGTGEITVTGFPFPQYATAAWAEATGSIKIAFFTTTTPITNGLTLYMVSAGTNVNFRYGNTDTSLPASELTNATAIDVVIVYQV